jgi:hypothetical protein
VESSALQSLFGRKPARPAERQARPQWRAPENQPLQLATSDPLQEAVKPHAIAAGFGLLALLGVGVLAAFIVDQTASSQAGPQAIAQPSPKPVEAKPSRDVESPKLALQSADQKSKVARHDEAPSPEPAVEPRPQIATPVRHEATQPAVAMIPHDDPRWARTASPPPALTALQMQDPNSSNLSAFAGPLPKVDLTVKPIGDPLVTAGISTAQRPVPMPGDPNSGPTDGGKKTKASRQAKIKAAVNMRSRGADEASVITVVPANATVGVIGCKSWCEIVYKNRRGWVYKGFVK